MNLFEFSEKFSDEKTCRMHLKEQREKAGIVCKNCGGEKHYWLKTIEKWQCTKCKSRTNIKAGTIMENSNIPVKVWFMCMHLMTATKKSFSALEMQRQLGLKRYEPVWYMMSKIRQAMGKRDSKYKLDGCVELDNAQFRIVDLPNKDRLGNSEAKPKLKRGKGSQRTKDVLVIVESKPIQSDIHEPQYKKKRSMGFIKMIIMDGGVNSEAINYEVKKNVTNKSSIISDKHTAYTDLKDVVKTHTAIKVEPKEAGKTFPWVHTSISNAKRQLLGTHHSINTKYLQNYLNEFCYKLNRRNFNTDRFDRLMIAGVNDNWF